MSQPPEDQPGRSSWVDRLVRWGEARRGAGAGSNRLLLGLSAAGLVIGVAVSLANLPSADVSRSLPLIGAAALLAACSFLINGIEFRCLSSWAGTPVGLVRSVEVSLMASAANALPIPGAALVKVQAMRGTGTRGRAAVVLVVFAAGVLTGLALIAAGGLALVQGSNTTVALIVVLVGLAGVAIATALLQHTVHPDRLARVVATMVAVEGASVVLMGVRIHLLFRGLGFSAQLEESFAIAVAGQLSTVVGIVPSGLGVREGLAALFGQLVGAGAATSVVVTALDRLVTYAVLVVMAGPLLLAARRRALRARRDTTAEPTLEETA